MADNVHLAVSVDDPLTADRLIEALKEVGIEAFSQNRGAASSAPFEAVSSASYAIYVPDSKRDEAAKVIQDELDAIEKDADENAKAAEEEELTGETKIES